MEKVQMVSRMIHEWAKRDIGNIFKEERILLARINGVQEALERGYNPFFMDLSIRLQCDLERILKQEEILWIKNQSNSSLEEVIEIRNSFISPP